MSNDPFRARAVLETPLGAREIARLDALDGVESLPYSIKVLLEAALRNVDGVAVTEDDVRQIAAYDARHVGETEIPFIPGRVVLQDFTGVPAVVDLAAMRSAIVRLTGEEGAAQKVNPLIPADLVIDHSVQVDAFARPDALIINSTKEFERNQERYEFLKWGQSAFANFRVVPPATGIVHQVNLEYLAKVVWDDGEHLYPDSLVGTDSHTTMINGLGVVGWGVGGIEAEAAMVGQPIYMLLPEVVGFRLTGKLPEGATATDLVLRVTEMLREHGVVDKFVEFYGPGLADMPLANRATIANMAPEYGATIGFFPVDEQTLKYLRLTGREDKLIDTIEQYYKEQGMWRDDSREIAYSSYLELDMSTVEPSLAGPTRPQDRIALAAMKEQWHSDLTNTFGKIGGCVDLHGRQLGGGGGNGFHHTGRPGIGGHRLRRRDLPPRRRPRGHRRDHVMHQHLEPGCDGRGRSRRPEGKSFGPAPQAMGEELPGARFEGRHRVPHRVRADGRPGESGFRVGRLRLHHLHRKLRPSARTHLGGDQQPRPRRGGGPLRQPQLRRADLTRCPGQLPGFATAGGRLCAGGNHRLGPDLGADRRRPRRQGRLPQGHLAHSGRDRRNRQRQRQAEPVPRQVQRRVHRFGGVARHRHS